MLLRYSLSKHAAAPPPCCYRLRLCTVCRRWQAILLSPQLLARVDVLIDVAPNVGMIGCTAAQPGCSGVQPAACSSSHLPFLDWGTAMEATPSQTRLQWRLGQSPMRSLLWARAARCGSSP